MAKARKTKAQKMRARSRQPDRIVSSKTSSTAMSPPVPKAAAAVVDEQLQGQNRDLRLSIILLLGLVAAQLIFWLVFAGSEAEASLFDRISL